MNIIFLGQGYEPVSKDSVGNYLIKFFQDNSFHSFTGITAFASQSGVNGLSKHISSAKKHLKLINIITGIDQKGTSKEALDALLEMNIRSYIFYQPSFTIFHPKIYLFEGEKKSELIIGSSNLTSQGLFTNIESSILISIDNTKTEDRVIVEHLKKYFKGIFDFTDPNLKKITKKLIKDLVKAKLIPTEAERKVLQDKLYRTDRKKTDSIISKIFPKRDIAKFPKEFGGTLKSAKKIKPVSIQSTQQVSSPKGKLIWTRKKLPASSVQVGGSGTNPTGGLRLVQDRFEVNGERISQTTYFRNEVFGNFQWRIIKTHPFVEAATIPFIVTILGKSYGTFKLDVRHKPSGEAGQHNYTTSISWGELSEIIEGANLTGKRLDLFAPKGQSKSFHIVIS